MDKDGRKLKIVKDFANISRYYVFRQTKLVRKFYRCIDLPVKWKWFSKSIDLLGFCEDERSECM